MTKSTSPQAPRLAVTIELYHPVHDRISFKIVHNGQKRGIIEGWTKKYGHKFKECHIIESVAGSTGPYRRVGERHWDNYTGNQHKKNKTFYIN